MAHVTLRVWTGEGQVEGMLIPMGGRPVHGVLPPVPTIPPVPTSSVLVPGRDASVRRREAQQGVLLGAWLAQASAVWGALREAMGRADDERLMMLVDAQESVLRALPWELLGTADDVLWVESGRLSVVRLGTGQPRQGGLTPWRMWSPTPGDAAAATLLDTLDASDEPTAGLWLWAAHGVVKDDAVYLQFDDGLRTAADCGPQVRATLERGLGVVLGVCSGGASQTAESDQLAARLLRWGLPFVVAPSRPLSVAAFSAFIVTFRDAIDQGLALHVAWERGTSALRALGHPHPAFRAHSLQLWVSQAHVLERAESTRVRGWPTPGPSAAQWLQDACVSGQVTLESLLQSRPSSVAGRLDAATSAWQEILFHARSVRVAVRGRVAGQTPRMAQLAAALSSEFTAESLCDALIASPGCPWSVPQASVVLEDAVDFETHRTPEYGAATAFIVWGGPEDGRVVRHTPGGVVGRWSATNTDGLYDGTEWVDPKLSRSVLVWGVPGEVTVKRTVKRWRDGHCATCPPGPLEVRVADVVAPTSGTWLVACEDQSVLNA